MRAPDAPPACPHVDRCGGCTRFAQPLAEQLAFKRERVLGALGRYRELAGFAVGAVESRAPLFAYRPRAKWVVGDRGEIGLFAKASDHEVVDLPECAVVEPAVARVGAWLREALAGEHRDTRLRSVDVRATTRGETLVTLGIARGADMRAHAEELARALHRRGVAGVAVSEADPRTPRVVAGIPERIAGADAVVDEVGPARVLATFGAFVQSHRGGAAAMAERALEAIRPLGARPRVLELFAGSGAIGLALAAGGAAVEMCESFAPAARRIEEAAASAGLDVKAHAVDALELLRRSRDPWDAIVVDPPRRGLEPALRVAIAERRPSVLVYVSCRPETWARDAAHFVRLGLRVASARPLDMMPQTDEVELTSIFVPAPRETPPPLFERDGVRVEDIPPHGRPAPPAELGLPNGASGLVATGAHPRDVRWTALAIVRGIPRAKGRLTRELTYRRLEVAGGYGIVLVEGTGPVQAVLASLAKIGHPVVGGGAPADRKTTTYLFEKHGLDRLALHVSKLGLGSGEVLESALPGDLDGVRASLRER
jgi:tRNA/tmRNA/rRNA uracil-C5-methylase (TrmA/RlmC/RlmD family)